MARKSTAGRSGAVQALPKGAVGGRQGGLRPVVDDTALAGIYRALIGGRFKELRVAAGITQKQAADAIGLWPTAVSSMENASSSIGAEKLMRLADLYGADRHETGIFILRYSNPWLYAMIFGDDVDADLRALVASRIGSPSNPSGGPSRGGARRGS